MGFLEQVLEGQINNIEAGMSDSDIQLKIGPRPIEPVLSVLGLTDVAEPYTKMFAKIPFDPSVYTQASDESQFVGVITKRTSGAAAPIENVVADASAA